MLYQWMMASLLFKIIELVLGIAVYEIIRYLVINKVRQIAAGIKGLFTRKK